MSNEIEDIRMTTEEIKASVNAKLAELGVTIAFEYAGWEKGQHAGYWVKWKGIVGKGSYAFPFDYGHGTGHLDFPALNRYPVRLSIDDKAEIERCLSEGRYPNRKPFAKPDPVSALYCLLLDAEAIDYPTFEDWADCVGEDQDSRKAESIYKKCVETGLALRRVFGDTVISELRELLRDF